MKFKVMFISFCCKRCIVTEGGTDKNQPGQKPPRTIEIEFVPGTFVRDFCTRPTKNWGVRDVCFTSSLSFTFSVSSCTLFPSSGTPAIQTPEFCLQPWLRPWCHKTS